MNYKIITAALVSLLFLNGCQKNESQSTSLVANQDSLVAKTVERLHQAIIDKDQTTLEEICSDGLSYGHSSGAIQDKKAFIDDVLNGPFDFLSIRVENQTIGFYDDLSIVRHTFVAKGLKDGDSVDLLIGSAHLYKPDSAGNYKLVLRQGYKLPQ